jgi:hypothetical protein
LPPGSLAEEGVESALEVVEIDYLQPVRIRGDATALVQLIGVYLMIVARSMMIVHSGECVDDQSLNGD